MTAVISMILTSSQHRKLAKILRQKAPTFEYKKRLLAHKQAAVHLALVRAQERNPALRPKSDDQRGVIRGGQNLLDTSTRRPRLDEGRALDVFPPFCWL
jgi:hypothetical protein